MEYFILKPDGEQTGMFSIDQIRAMLNTGFIGLDTRYWHEGISDWQPLDRIEESLNFPEPSPDEPHAAPPPPRKLTGSLARAIPSPQQQQLIRKSGQVGLGPVPAAAPEKPVVPEAPRRGADVPTPSLQFEYGSDVNGATAPATLESTPVTAAPFAPVRERRRFRLSTPQLYALSSLLVALAIIAAIVASRHPAKSPLSKVTLTSQNTYVLTDQAAIKSFEDDMRNSPVAQSLTRQVGQTTDPVLLQRLNIALQQETARHLGDVLQNYLHSGKAEVIEEGTYSVLSYIDDNGALTVPRAGQPWVALTYRGQIVYAYEGTEFKLTPQ